MFSPGTLGVGPDTDKDSDIKTVLFWCNVSPSPTDVSPTENSWMLHPLDKVSLGYFAPDRTIPSLCVEFYVWAERASDGGAPTQ